LPLYRWSDFTRSREDQGAIQVQNGTYAAKLDMEHLASSILAASVCKGVRFNGDALVTSLTAAIVLLGRKRTEDAFFSAMSANIDEMSAKGKEAWCAATIKAAKERNSEMVTEDNDEHEGK
jgi:hypothetical protein